MSEFFFFVDGNSEIQVMSSDPISTTAAAAAAKSLQSCPTLCDPIGGSPQAPPSLGCSRQEHWSGVPLPSTSEYSSKLKT